MVRTFLILLTLFTVVQPAEGADITLLPESEVTESMVRLGDIAELDMEQAVAVALESIPVCQAPAPGEKLYLKSINIKRNLIKTNKVPPGLSWQGPGGITIYRKGIQITAARVQEIIDEYLRLNSDVLPEAKINFIPGSLPLPFVLPTGKLAYEVIPSHPSIIGSSRFSIIFKIDDDVVKNMSVRGKLQALGKVVVAAKALRKGTILNKSHLSLAVVDISRPMASGSLPEEFIGKLLKKSIKAGAPISLKSVESLPLIYRGQKVKIVLRSGSLFLTATGLAHGDGKLEQMIRVQNLSSNKILYCRVAAPGLVEVML